MRTPDVVADASTRTAKQLQELFTVAFDCLATEPGIGCSSRERLRRTAVEWGRSLGRGLGPSLEL